MIARRHLLTLAATTALTAPALTTPVAAEPLNVVASFSILGDMVENVGGEHVDVTTLVGPDGDTHVYEPTPADARAISEADLVIVNGLEFEGWMERLLDASDYQGPVVVATEGIDLISFEDDHDDHDEHAEGETHDDHDEHAEGEAHDDHDEHAEGEAHDDHDEHAGHDHGEFDPHGWQDLGNARIYVNNITSALIEADPDNQAAYANAADAYKAELAALDAEVRAMIDAVPEDRRKVVTSHDAFQYFGRAYGIEFLAPVGISTEAEPSAADVAELIRQIREEDIRAVFAENITDSRLIEQITAETDAEIGGTLYPGALSGPDGPAPTYLDLFRHNASEISQALTS